MALLLKKMDGEPLKYKVFFYFMAYSVFRHGEILDLEWKDLDFENNITSAYATPPIKRNSAILHQYNQN